MKTTNCPESINAPIAHRTAKVTAWRTSDQKNRWLAAALLDIETRPRKSGATERYLSPGSHSKRRFKGRRSRQNTKLRELMLGAASEFQLRTGLTLAIPSGISSITWDRKTRGAKPRDLEITLRRSIALEHPRWTWQQSTAAVQEAEAGQGPYAVLAADLMAANGA